MLSYSLIFLTSHGSLISTNIAIGLFLLLIADRHLNMRLAFRATATAAGKILDSKVLTLALVEILRERYCLSCLCGAFSLLFLFLRFVSVCCLWLLLLFCLLATTDALLLFYFGIRL